MVDMAGDPLQLGVDRPGGGAAGFGEDLLQEVFEVGFAALPRGGGGVVGIPVDEHDVVGVTDGEVADHPGHEDGQVAFVGSGGGHGVEVPRSVDDEAEDVPTVGDIAFDQGF